MKGINIAETIAITSVMIIKRATAARAKAHNALADMIGVSLKNGGTSPS